MGVKDNLLQSKAEVGNLYLNPDSHLKCDKCKNMLGFLRVLRKALFKKPNQIYVIRCKKCGYLNTRIKGKYKEEINNRWKEQNLKKN